MSSLLYSRFFYYGALTIIAFASTHIPAHAQDMTPYSACADAPKSQAFTIAESACKNAIKASNGKRVEAVKVSKRGMDTKKLVAAARANQVTGALLMTLARRQFDVDNTYSDKVCEYTYQAKDVFNLGVVTPKDTDPMHLYYKDAENYFLGCGMVAFPKAQMYLKVGKRAEIARLLKPLAYLGHGPAKNSLGMMDVKYYGPAPSEGIPKPPAPIEGPKVSSEDIKLAAQKAYKSCTNVPSPAAIPAAMKSCGDAYARLSNLAVGGGTDADLYYYNSALAAFQHGRLLKKQNPSDRAGLCKLLHSTDRQFRQMKAKPQKGTQHFTIATQTKQVLAACNSKGL